MRLRYLAAGAVTLAMAAPASANTLNFGSIGTSHSNNQVAGNAGDRSETSTQSVSNGANDSTASANLRAQVSADHGITTNPTAIIDRTFTWDIPYTVTRTITQAPAGGAVPIQTISFTISTTGEVAKDNSQTTGGLGQASSFNGTISSLGGLFGSQTLNIGASQTGGGGVASTPVSTSDTPNFSTSVNFSGPNVGEISLVGQIPTDYRLWEDFVAPQALDYTQPFSVTQSLTDTLRVSFRLRAESRPSGSVSTTGGEAIACFGQKSTLGSFALDNSRCNQSGVNITGQVTQTGTTSVPIPEPGTLLLIGGGLLGIGLLGRRKLR